MIVPRIAWPRRRTRYGIPLGADFMVEMETMGPVTQLLPGATMGHVETWKLVRPIDWARWRAPG